MYLKKERLEQKKERVYLKKERLEQKSERVYLKKSASKKEVSPKSLETPLFPISVEPEHLVFLSNPVSPLLTQWYQMEWFDRQDDGTEYHFPVNS